jgi:hypothetical protein
MRLLEDVRGIAVFLVAKNHLRVLHMLVARVSQSHTVTHWYNLRAGPVYHPSAPCGNHVVRSLGLIWTSKQMKGGRQGRTITVENAVHLGLGGELGNQARSVQQI